MILDVLIYAQGDVELTQLQQLSLKQKFKVAARKEPGDTQSEWDAASGSGPGYSKRELVFSNFTRSYLNCRRRALLVEHIP